MRKLKNYTPTKFMAKDSRYDEKLADYAVGFIECLSHTKGTWAGKKFELIDWQERIIRDLFGILKPNNYRQFNTAYVEIPKKQGKSELVAAVALLLCCGDGEERAEVYGAAADRQQASIVFEVAADMVRMCPALNKRVKILASQKRMVFTPTNSFYQVLSAEAYSKHGFNIHGVVFDDNDCHLPHTKCHKKITLKGIYAPFPLVSGVSFHSILDIIERQNLCLFSRVKLLYVFTKSLSLTISRKPTGTLKGVSRASVKSLISPEISL